MTIKSFIQFLLSNNGWKSSGASALFCLLVLALLSSFLFSVAIFLIKLALIIGALAFTAQTVWLAYPLLEKRYKRTI